MSSDNTASSQAILDAFEKATTIFNLCPNRVWSVARHDLPRLLPAAKATRSIDDHRQCTVDFCIYSQRDFTAVEQRHECEHGECSRLQLPQDQLERNAKNELSTVWSFGKINLNAIKPYMAISHVWSDGTGTGAWVDGEVNKCLWLFFRDIARIWECEGIWWDTISIPREKSARAKAIRNIQHKYQDATFTLVHDCFLRNSAWVDGEAACFAILMSPWFSRGWTALELANSRKVKVLFKGHKGFLVKDLDEQILAKDSHASEAHKRATDLIKSLRKGITTLDDLLVALGSRCTSWPKDMAIISGLLVGVDVAPDGPKRDVLQQDIYRRILIKIGSLATGHLFHDSATICKGSSWCPINLFSMPISGQPPSLTIDEELDLIGTWDILPLGDTFERNCIWNGTHPLLRMQLQLALKDADRCVLLTENGTQAVDRALLVKPMHKYGTQRGLSFQYIGALHFHPALPKGEHIKIEVRMLGDASSYIVNDQASAWEYVKEMSKTNRTLPGKLKKKAYHKLSDGKIKALWPTKVEMYTRRTALHYAVMRGDQGSFKALLKLSDISAQDALGRLPFHIAAERGDDRMLFHLLEELSNISINNPQHRYTILHRQCKEGQTILHRAAYACSEAAVDLLLVAGIDPNLTDRRGRTALHVALSYGFDLVFKRILSDPACDVNTATDRSYTLLFYAVESGNEQLARTLIKKGADVNKASGSKKLAPLRSAVCYRHHAMIEFLVSSGSDVNARDMNHVSLLHNAASRGDRATMLPLLKGGAKADVKDQSGLTPLHYAARCDNGAAVELLISNGANVNAKEKSGLTPLHYAVRSGNLSSVELLVRNGANIKMKSWLGETPSNYAKKNGYNEIAAILRKKA